MRITRQRQVRSIRSGAELPTANGRLVFKPTAAFAETPADIDALPFGRPSGVSSNTVVTLGETLFLKGYRHVREGINPELEMGRFLTEVARYPNCVPVLGALEYMTADGRTMTLAMVQRYVANQGDGTVSVIFVPEARLAFTVPVSGRPRGTATIGPTNLPTILVSN